MPCKCRYIVVNVLILLYVAPSLILHWAQTNANFFSLHGINQYEKWMVEMATISACKLNRNNSNKPVQNQRNTNTQAIIPNNDPSFCCCCCSLFWFDLAGKHSKWALRAVQKLNQAMKTSKKQSFCPLLSAKCCFFLLLAYLFLLSPPFLLPFHTFNWQSSIYWIDSFAHRRFSISTPSRRCLAGISVAKMILQFMQTLHTMQTITMYWQLTNSKCTF